MKDKEVLQKAIEKAIKNGFVPNYKPFSWFPKDVKVSKQQIIFLESKKPRLNNHSIEILLTFNNDSLILDKIRSDENIIFSHDFAKAFWSSEDISNALTPQKNRFELHKDNGEKFFVNSKDIHAWQYHLQQMVLEENPIQYLKSFINAENSLS